MYNNTFIGLDVHAVSVVLPVTLFDDGGVALNGDVIGGFGRHRDVVVGMLPGTWAGSFPSSSW